MYTSCMLLQWLFLLLLSTVRAVRYQQNYTNIYFASSKVDMYYPQILPTDLSADTISLRVSRNKTITFKRSSPSSDISFVGESENEDFVHLLMTTGPKTGQQILVGTVVSISTSTVYQIQPNVYGKTMILERKSDSFRKQASGRRLEPVVIKSHSKERRVERGNDAEIATIDIMVVWTLAAECERSGLARLCVHTDYTHDTMHSTIELGIAEVNEAFKNSKIHARLRLVHAYRDDTGYVELDAATNLNNLVFSYDVHMQSVHAKRSKFGADMMALITAIDPLTCGRGYYLDPVPVVDFFALTLSWDCATGDYAFAHEIGHLFACKHDRGSENACDVSTDTNYGYRSKTKPIRTIMASDCNAREDCDQNPFAICARVNYFSSPNETPLGVVGDVNNNCAAQINKNRHVAANLVATRGEAAPTTLGDVQSSVLTSNIPSDTDSDAPSDSPSDIPSDSPSDVPSNGPSEASSSLPTITEVL